MSISKVAVAVELSDASWRDFLLGFCDYAKRNVHWDIHVVQSARELNRTAPSCHCVVTGLGDAEGARSLAARTGVPVVAVGFGPKSPSAKCRVAFVRNDNVDIGRFGAGYFASLGKFASAGFVHSRKGDDWSRDRERGFMETFGDNVEKASFTGRLAPGTNADIESLAKWLKRLAKPAAVMAAWDTRGVHVLRACRLAEIEVPYQVAVIGVDNDRLSCDFANPPLTSVMPDHVLEGEIAAKTAEKMMSGRSHGASKALQILNTAKKMVERESARPVAPATVLVTRAMEYIDANAARNIKAPDVVKAMGVSRSLLDMRFRELRGETVSDAIANRRLEEVKRQLSETSLSIKAVSAACGFGNVNHLKNLFRRKFGMSMREWRLR